MQLTKTLRGLFSKPFGSIGPREAAEALKEGALLLDVREKGEWDSGHIAGAVHIPLGQLGRRAGELSADAKVIAVCQSGMRSSKAAEHLARAGHDVTNLAGGMNAWTRSGLPVVRPGRAGKAGPRR
ncbi:MAG: rhodanese-like domain-containing protein [Acidimicrobiales bacterium]